VAACDITQCLAIAKVPIGARVLAENPRPEEFDDSFAEPVQSEWSRVSFLIVRNDLSVVEAEFIRPRAWIEGLGLVKGARIDLAVPELKIDGLAEVTAVRDCPPIAEGEGRVVTGRFVTRDVANVVRITLASGTEIRATDVHPVWSIDREDWVPAGKLEPGEHVDTLSGLVAVASVEPLDRHPAVYNLEVHGEHVYRVTVDGVLVHNACPTELHHSFPRFLGGGPQDLTPLPTRLHRQLHVDLNRFLSRYTDDFGNTMSHGASNPGWAIRSNFTLNERERPPQPPLHALIASRR
jgi:hypothetical protein